MIAVCNMYTIAPVELEKTDCAAAYEKYGITPAELGDGGYVAKKVTNEKSWQGILEGLEQYKSEHGSCNVSTLNDKLGRWLHTQKKCQKNDGSRVERKK